MANKPNLSPIAKVNNSSSNMISPTTSINLDETSPNKSNLDSSLNNLSGLSQSSTVQDYSLMLLKKSREVERLNDGLILQEALRPADTDDLFELFEFYFPLSFESFTPIKTHKIKKSMNNTCLLIFLSICNYSTI